MDATTSSSGDAADGPARVLRLLWRRHLGEPRGRRGPRQKVSTDAIVEAAISLADAEGLAAVSVRRVAQAVGLSPMSLYTYVPDRDALIGLMVDETVSRTPLPRWQGPPRERLRTLSEMLWDEYHRHPWLLDAESHRPWIGPGVSDRYEAELRAVEGCGLEDIAMDHTISLIETHAAAASRRHLESLRAVEESGRSDLEWWEQNGPVLAEVMPPDAYPVSGRVGTAVGTTYQAVADLRAGYEFGLEVILDGIEARLPR
ncbi:TetR/AcrR family transcriptional regulator [Brachybacterium sp. AOP43-C2-M15]|uniref:TetR/AcrR family transcriptional regulator n=1 Tax=Brachybacterium sp. AOP43-C2-M15 TaxID=3457661 RepID=UPI0040337C18